MRISTRLHIGTLLSIVTVFVALVYTLLTFHRINQLNEEGKKADEIGRCIFELNILTNDYLLYHEKRAQTQWQMKYDTLSNIISTLDFQEPDKQEILGSIKRNHEDIGSLFSQLLSIYKDNIPNRTSFINKQLEERIVSQLLVTSQKMVSNAFRLERKNREETMTFNKRTYSILMGLFFVLSSIIAITSFLVARSIIKPINQFQNDVEVIGTGNLDHKVGISSEDEIGQLSKAFDRMTTNLQEITASKDELDKEVYVRMKAQEELQRHRDDLEELVKKRTSEIESVNKELQVENAERKQAEEELRRKENYFRSLLHNMHEDILVVDRDYRISDVNNAVLITMKLKREDIIGRYCYDVFYGLKTPCDIHGKKCPLITVFETGTPSSARYKRLKHGHPDSRVDILYSPLKDNKEKTTNVIIAIRDITEITQAQEAMQKSEEKYRTILETIEDGYYEVDLAGNYEFFNDALCRIRGYTREEFMGLSYRKNFDPENAEKIFKIFNRVYKTGEPIRRIEIPSKRKDGTEIRTEVSISLRRDSAGQPIGFQGIVRDVTERRRIENQLHQVQKMEAIGTLTGGISHDFNNILTSIIGNTHLVLMDIDKDDPLRDEIEEIKASGERAAALIRQLLAFSRKQVIQAEVMDPNEILEGMEKMLKRLIREDIELHINYNPEVWTIFVDPTQMEQVIMNLAVNARDAMPEGGNLTIELTNQYLDEAYFVGLGIEAKPGPYVMLSADDTGVGMDNETQSHIFEPFFTTKEREKGTGLGLSTVYGIVKQNNGFVFVYSEPGKGTTFKIYLPKVEADGMSDYKETIIPDELNGSETILIVEDDKQVKKLAQRILKQHGYDVHTAENGETALKIAEKYNGPLHLLLTDMVMPGMNGPEVAEHMKLMKDDIKVVYMSGYADNTILNHNILSQGAGLLEKPFTAISLLEKVRTALDS